MPIKDALKINTHALDEEEAVGFERRGQSSRLMTSIGLSILAIFWV